MSQHQYPSWSTDSRREQKRAERYRAAIATGDHLLPWQRKVVAVVEQADTPIVIVSVPRAQGKSWLAGRLVARCLTPGDPLFVMGGESALISNTRAQARFVTNFARQFLAETQSNIDKVYSFAMSANGPGSITHKPTGTAIKTFAANPRYVQGLVGCRLVIADECGSWKGVNGLATWEALTTALGKQKMTIFAISTIAPSAPNTWWYEAVLGEDGDDEGDGVFRYVLKGDLDKWASWPEIIRVNPAALINTRLHRQLKTELGKAQRSERAKREFLAYRLNVPVVGDPEAEPVLPLEDWQAVRDRAVAERVGPCIAGIDAGGSTSFSAAAGYWPTTGRLEVVALMPGIPSIDTQADRDDTDASAYELLVASGSLLVAEGFVQVPLRLLFDVVRSWKPATVTSDTYRDSEIKRFCSGLCEYVARPKLSAAEASDLAAFRSHCGDRNVNVASGVDLLDFSLSQARVTRDTGGFPKVEKVKRRSHDDVIRAALLAFGHVQREWNLDATDEPEGDPDPIVHVAGLRW